MGTINSYKYPEHEIDKAIDIIETIHNNGITQRELLAEKLGHSSVEGGAFRNKLTSLDRYGLIISSTDIELTRLAEKIVAPKPGSNERKLAISSAVKNVDLLEELYERLDYESPDGEIWYHIVEVTDADRAEAQDKAGDIQKLYESGLKYVRAAQNLSENGETDSETTEQRRSDDSSKGFNENIQVPDDADATLITPDARIDIRSRATYVAARALFEDVGHKYRSETHTDSGEDVEDITEFI